jgi:hypothetical protein
VIFRREEWFKVFLHETIHNLGLDFSAMDITSSYRLIQDMFAVDANVEIYEAYAETWARMMNVFFISFLYSVDKEQFVVNARRFMTFEAAHCTLQTVKVLDFMGLRYDQFLTRDPLVKTAYREHTNVLAYFVITMILINNYSVFLKWCFSNNGGSLMQFKRTQPNVKEFIRLIGSLRGSVSKRVHCMEDVFHETKNKTFLQKNLRMTVLELG